jgi:hypothetical protein
MMFRLTIVAAVSAFALAGSGCGGCGDSPSTPDAPVDAPPFDSCDGNPGSFARHAMLALLGRRPVSQAEVDVYVDLFEAAELAGADPRATVARTMMQDPAFRERWVDQTMDALRVQRIDYQSQIGCWGRNDRGTVTPGLAMAVRDQTSAGNGDGQEWTMLDLARSAVALDDVTPVYRAHVFAMMAWPIPAANVPPVEAELARRADFGAMFLAGYTNRDMVCLGCHTSDASVTDNEDPLLDRHWPVPGRPEMSVYGASQGIAPERADAVFRVDGFVLGGFDRPWSWNNDCGVFSSPGANIGNDPAGIDGKLGSLVGQRLTAHDLDAALKRGFDALRGVEPPIVSDSIADPDTALAWLVTLNMVEDVWREVIGTPLTIANHFPRNAEASEMLFQLASRYTSSGYSLRELLVAIVSSDYFDRLPPEAGCSAPYTYPPVFDPWVIGDPDPARRMNGAGDAVVPLSARTLASASEAALGWPARQGARFPDYGEFGYCSELSCSEATGACNSQGDCCTTASVVCGGGVPESVYQRGVGHYLRNSERGFRGLDFQARLVWEERYGACEAPDGFPTDFVDGLLARASGGTVEDVVVAMKDRFLGEPVIVDDAERSALASLLGGPLDRPGTAVTEAQVRSLCGVFLASPQFLLQGMAGRGGTRPILTATDDDYPAVCADVATRDIGIAGQVVSCGPDGLVLVAGRVAPKPPATVPVSPPSDAVRVKQRKRGDPRRTPAAPY